MNQEKIKQYKQELCVLWAIDSTLFCLVLIDFTHILQGGFTGIGAIIYDCPSASEATLKNMGRCLI